MNNVRDLLRKKGANVITIQPDTNVGTAVRLLFQHKIGGLPVVSNGRVLGFVSERDIVRAVDLHREGVPQLKAEQVMWRPPPVCCTAAGASSRPRATKMLQTAVLEQRGTHYSSTGSPTSMTQTLVPPYGI
jgi:CBS domain-containing protein